MAEESETQLTFTVKSSNDAKYAITIGGNATVSDLKTKLSTSDFADLPADRQRLIYSGRVLKDHETLSSYKIKDGHTIHLVKGAESNNRQNPANQGGVVSPSASGNAANVPTNIAAGTGTHNPLAQLTGARYAGFHQLPGADMFGADGGMGAPPDPDQLLRMLENPNFAQQMNEAMNNPDVINMMRNNPMLRNNPMAQQIFDNPEMRRMLMNPDFIRMQMNLQRSMGGGAGGAGAFPAPGVTDQQEGQQNQESQTTQNTPQQPAANPFAMFGGGANAASGANPFAALFGGNPAAAQGSTPAGTPPVQSAGQGTPAQGTTPGAVQQNPLAGLLGGMGGAQGGAGGNSDPFADMTRQMMQNPEMMRAAMNMFGGGAGAGAGGEGAGPGAGAGFNPFAAMGGMGSGGAPAQPADNRPPEERYAEQLSQLNAMGFYEFDRNVRALRMSGGSVEGAVDMLLSGGV